MYCILQIRVFHGPVAHQIKVVHRKMVVWLLQLMGALLYIVPEVHHLSIIQQTKAARGHNAAT